MIHLSKQRFAKALICMAFLPLSIALVATDFSKEIMALERGRILGKAATYLKEQPITVTANQCERSQGNSHDFYSEGDYWWPNPEDPTGPYIRRDGESNPEGFIAHRKAMIRLSEHVATLTSAFLLTEDHIYSAKAISHLQAWFIESDSRMNPDLLYGQAIQGLHTGRSIGIIDTLHLVEVARSAKVLIDADVVDSETEMGIKEWFGTYLNWLNNHPYGQQEKKHPNNHGVCWSLQAASFADLVGDSDTLDWIRNEFKTVYVDQMMDDRGGFPAELARTKPYGYSLFVLDALTALAQVASTEDENLFEFKTSSGKGMELGITFLAPYVADKSTWFLAPDVQYWDEWPVRHCSLLFGSIAYENQDWFDVWKQLEADPTTFETLRNFPVRHPLLWVHSFE